MGIQGLTGFVDDNQHLLEKVSLHGTKVIIDGNNLYHFLYYYLKVNHQYGGDYDNFGQKVHFFFRTLLACKVEPFVVFDGAYHTDDRKLKTSLKRAKDRIHLAGFLSHMGRGKILPINAHSTFVAVLDHMNIPHVTCDYEADSEIASLASEWNCPVMTNDSDFFVYDIKAGVILLDYINLQIREETHPHHAHGQMESTEPAQKYKYIFVELYHLQNLLRGFPGMETKLVALFASLLGNDYVDSKHLVPFFDRVRLPKVSSHSLFSTRRHGKMLSLLTWLEHAEKLDIALERILTFIKKENREKVKTLLLQSVDSYTVFHSKLSHYLSEQSSETVDGRAYAHSSILMTYEGMPLPQWILRLIRSGQLPAFILNMIVTRRCILLTQVEVLSQPSAYHCALPIRQAIYGMIFRYDGKGRGDSSDEAGKRKHSCFVEEVDRDQKNQKREWISPVYELRDGSLVPSLCSVSQMQESERIHILLNSFKCKLDAHSLNGVPKDIQLLYICMLHWIENATPSLDAMHVGALLVCVIYLHAKAVLFEHQGSTSTEIDTDPVESITENVVAHELSVVKSSSQQTNGVECESPMKKDQTNLACGDGPAPLEFDSCNNCSPYTVEELLTKNCSDDSLQCAVSKLCTFTSTPRHRNVSEFHGLAIHSFSQFQTCFQAGSALNTLLMTPLLSVSADKFFSGTFLYNLYRELKSRKDYDLYIQELLGRSSFLCVLYTHLKEMILTNVSDGVLEFKLPGNKRTKKAKSKGGKEEACSNEPENESVCASRNSVNVPNVLGDVFDVSNAFAGLGIDDENLNDAYDG